MQGPHDQDNNPLENPTGRYRAVLNGTGKHTIPQRPPHMPYLEKRPPEPRVGRLRQQQGPRRRRPNYLVWGAVLVAFAIIVFVLSYTIYDLSQAFTATSGAGAAAQGFLDALSGPHPNYTQAYGYLGPNITIRPDAETNFQEQAQQADSCFGMITNYSEVANSAVVQNGSLSYTYNITRSKAPGKPYQLRLTLQQDPTDNNAWKIVDYGDSLSPGGRLC